MTSYTSTEYSAEQESTEPPSIDEEYEPEFPNPLNEGNSSLTYVPTGFHEAEPAISGSLIPPDGRTMISSMTATGYLRNLPTSPLFLKLVYKFGKVEIPNTDTDKKIFKCHKHLFSDGEGYIDIVCYDQSEGKRLTERLELEEGKVYQVSAGQLQKIKKEFCLADSTNNGYSLVIKTANHVQPSSLIDIPDCPMKFNFKTLEYLNTSGNLSVGEYCDVIAVIDGKDPIKGKTPKKLSKSKEITLKDGQQKYQFTVRATLWDVQRKRVTRGTGGTIILIKNARIERKYNENVYLSVGNNSCIFKIETESDAWMLSPQDKEGWLRKLLVGKPSPKKATPRKAVANEANNEGTSKKARVKSLILEHEDGQNQQAVSSIRRVNKVLAESKDTVVSVTLKRIKFSGIGRVSEYFGCPACRKKCDNPEGGLYTCLSAMCEGNGFVEPTKLLVANAIQLFEKIGDLYETLNDLTWFGNQAPFLCGDVEENQIVWGVPFDVDLKYVKKYSLWKGTIQAVRRSEGTLGEIAGPSLDRIDSDAPAPGPSSSNLPTEEQAFAGSTVDSAPFSNWHEIASRQISRPLNVVVTPAANFMDFDDSCYHARSNPRGLALVINIAEFLDDPKNQKRRDGAYADTNHVSLCLEQMGFKVEGGHNTTSKQLQGVIQRFKNKLETMAYLDCVVIAVMSHGIHGYIEMADHVKVEMWENFIFPFSDSNCPALKDKPKIFLFQACQEFDHNYANQSGSNQSQMTQMRDTIVCFPAVPGKPAHRHTVFGSWFIYVLVEVLMKHSHDKHFEEMLAMVRQELAQFDTGTGIQQLSHSMPLGFTKKLYFNPPPK